MKSKLQLLIEDAGYDCQVYSGRGMMGKECLGVSTSKKLSSLAGDLMLKIAVEAQTSEDLQEIDEAIRDFMGLREDALGLGGIFYFPGVTYHES